TNRISKLEDQIKKPKPAKEREADQAELASLKQIATAMEQGEPASRLNLSKDEEKAVRSFQLLTLKPELVLVNIGDSRVGQDLPAELSKLAPTAMQAPVKLELELQDLPEEERLTFMKEMGLEGFSAVHALQSIFRAMGQIVFFTVGEDECRAWSLGSG